MITLIEKRQKLLRHCENTLTCCRCKLFGTTCNCGRGQTFTTKTNRRDYDMKDDEINKAFDIVFGTKQEGISFEDV